ncbi:MAG: peptide chain release factor N(5)-glutamine methyltransferase [Lachnospiraceae bacterium]|nr:peptide chain release factor N(5)-glutamine methyltransferase [Lachnospiraceae bacterium]
MLHNKLTYQELYRWGRELLLSAGVPDAETDARLLLEWCCGTDRNTLLVHGSREVSTQEYEKYQAAVDKRQRRVPLQYITGEQEFMGLTFSVNQDVLVPRQDTEVLVEEVLRNLHDGMHILDMCTGSGCILLSLLRYSNDCTGVGVDLSEEALWVARKNAGSILQIPPEEEKPCVRFLRSDLFRELKEEEKFDIIVSNPPYIRTSVIDTLMPEVREYEPPLALDGREDGLYFYRQIIARAGAYLYREGMLFLEIGYDQGEDVTRLMEEAGYTQVEVFKDYASNDRVVQGVWC